MRSPSVFWHDYVLYVYLYLMCQCWYFPFSWPVFLSNQYSAVEAHGLQDVNPHRTSQCVFLCVCVWGRMVPCISVHCSLTGLNRVTAVLSIRSPFCVEMIQCASLGSYWSQWTEGRRSKTESSCNMLRHLLDVRNKGFDVTDSCQCSSLGQERSCDLVCGGCVKKWLLSWMCRHDLSSCLCHNTSCC